MSLADVSVGQGHVDAHNTERHAINELQALSYLPERYGADGDGVSDDTAAIQSAIDAANAAGGGTVLLSKLYGWSGNIIVKEGVSIKGVSSNKLGIGLKRLSGTAKIKFGDYASSNYHLGRVSDFVIDGDNLASSTDMVVIEVVLGHFQNVQIRNSGGRGCYIWGAQNSTFISFDVMTHGTDSLVIDKGAGDLSFTRCEINGGANRSLVITQSEASSGGAYPYAPVQISFNDCIIENNIPCAALVDIEAGNVVKFNHCAISINNASAVSGGYLVRIKDNPTYPTIAAQVEFESCTTYGGSASQASVFYVKGVNYLTTVGHSFFQNSASVFSYDGAANIEELGVIQVTAIPTKFNALSGGSTANFDRRGIRKQSTAITVNGAGQTSNLDTAKYKYFPILMNAVGASITTLNLNGAIGGEEITLFIAQTVGSGTITWPSTVKFISGDPINPGALTTTAVHLRFDGTNWIEMGRSVATTTIDAEYIRDTIATALVAGSGVSITVNDAGDTITLAVDSAVEDERIRDVIGTALTAGSGMTITVNDAGDTITLAVDNAIEDERIRDVIGTALVAGSGVTITVNDAGDTITLAVDNTVEDERIRDVIGTALVAGTGVSVTVNDAGDTITLASTIDAEFVRDTIGSALVAGSGVTVTVNDAGDTITLAIDNTVEDERIRDVIGTALTAGAGVTVTVNDAGDTITVASTIDAEYIRDTIGTALVAGTNMTITVNDAGDTITFDASGGGSTITPNVQTGTTYTLAATDAGKVVEMNNASANTVTVPPNSSVAFAVGTVLQVRQVGAGQTTIAPGSGVTLRNVSSLTTRVQWSTIMLYKRATDEWVVSGDVS